jgi:hypothetical protein
VVDEDSAYRKRKAEQAALRSRGGGTKRARGRGYPSARGQGVLGPLRLFSSRRCSGSVAFSLSCGMLCRLSLSADSASPATRVCAPVCAAYQR